MLESHLNINMSVLCHREDTLGGHQKEVSIIQLHAEGDVSVGWVLEAAGIPHLWQAAVKLGKGGRNEEEINYSQMKVL